MTCLLMMAGALVGAVIANGPETQRRLYYDRVGIKIVEWGETPGSSPQFRVVWADEKGEQLFFPLISKMPHPYDTRVEVTGDRIRIVESATLEEEKEPGKKSKELRYYSRVLRPAQSGTFEAVFDDRFNSFESIEQAKAREPQVIPPKYPAMSGAWLPLPDDSFIDVFKSFAVWRETRDNAALAAQTNALLEKHPNDPVALLCALDGAILCRDIERMQALLSRHASALRQSDVPFLHGALEQYEEWLEGAVAAAEGRNLAYVEPDKWTEWVDRIEAEDLSRLIHIDLQFPVLVPTVAQFPENRHSAFVFVKVMSIRGVFCLLAGDVKGAERTFHALHKACMALMKTRTWPINGLIGMSLLRYPISGEELVYLSGCATADQIRALWPRLDESYRAQSTMSKLVLEHLARHEEAGRDAPGFSLPIEFETRSHAALARQAAVHTAAAARYELLDWVELPSSTKGWFLLPLGPDPDPFGDGPLQARREAEEYVVYSVGPDRDDDGARVEYDPTNGTLSSGDIALRFGRKPQYPFAWPGGLPQTRDEILAKFPAGLPEDPFAMTRKLSLVMNDEVPPLIWSIGPGNDENDLRATPSSLDAAGPRSFWELPPGPLTRMPPRGTGVARTQSMMYFYSNKPEQPPYDPTNGMTSKGHIYWRVGTAPPK